MDNSKSNNVSKGIISEDIAIEFLTSSGYDLLEVNWRSKRAEIDIIAKDGDVLVFVEVKSRSTAFFGDPARAVDHKKRKLLVAAATSYMDSIGYDWKIRFDIITIILRTKEDFTLEHYKDAFFPSL